MHSDFPDMKESQSKLDKLKKRTNELMEEKDIVFMYHSETFIDVDAIGWEHNIHIPAVEEIERMISDEAKDWPALDAYLNLYNYSASLKGIDGCGRNDGIHFEPVCNYQAMITQWDFNWLEALGVIEPSPRIKVVAHPDAPNSDHTIFEQPGEVVDVHGDQEGKVKSSQ